MPPVIRLHPAPREELALEGLFLDLDLRTRLDGGSYVYTDFVASLDGKISTARADGEVRGVPPALANPRDWRLYQELAIQADAVVVSGRHLRTGAHPVVTVYDDADLADLARWRPHRGLPDLPALVVVSRSLDFDPTSMLDRGHRVIVATGNDDPQARRSLESLGAEVLPAGGFPAVSAGDVDGDALVDGLAALGLRVVFSGAGPSTLHTLMRAGRLDTVFLTMAFRIIAGARYATLVEGDGFDPPWSLAPAAMYLDEHGPGDAAQLFARLEATAPVAGSAGSPEIGDQPQ